MTTKHAYTFQQDLKKRLKNPKFKKAWEEEAQALQAIAKGEQEYRKGNLRSVNSLNELR